MVAIDPSLSPLLKNLEASVIQLEEVALACRDYARRIEINPERLEEIENRTKLILGDKGVCTPLYPAYLNFARQIWKI
jgi:DNA repair ATPase RecN